MKNLEFLNKALACLKPVNEQDVAPVGTVTVMDDNGQPEVSPATDYASRELRAGDRITLDFGDHFVGYFRMKLGYTGSHPDAPVLLRLRFAENAKELLEKKEEYHGWVCPSWIQDEQIHVDIVPSVVSLPRRYALRYAEIEVLEISSKFNLVIEDVKLRAVSGADDSKLIPCALDDEFSRIDAIAVRTLHNCKQVVFEDGPKRDRRLWLGDLRLQAMADYYTYRDYDMVKACLYLFAALPMPDGWVGACLFLEPEPEVDDTFILDYSLLYVNALLDYYKATGDIETLRDLKDTAFLQIDLAAQRLDERSIIKDSDERGWCFLDWNLDLNRQAGAQGVLLYSLKAAFEIAVLLNDLDKKRVYDQLYYSCLNAANEHLWDEEAGFYVSGADRQISWASQIWMILGGACDRSRARDILKRLPGSEAFGMVTPYIHHYYIEALIESGERSKALNVIREYWGGMVKHGADTFWELYNPDNPYESPYGGTIVNSYCHAWSCAPAYFLRRYFTP